MKTQSWNSLRSSVVYGATVIFLGVVGLGGLIHWRSRPLPFSAAAWKNQQHLRPQMVTDLLTKSLTVGMSRREVERLLGVPAQRDSRRKDHYTYWIGDSGVDDLWLDVGFQNDLVVSIERYPD